MTRPTPERPWSLRRLRAWLGGARPARPHHAVRLVLERLEDRVTPTTYAVTNPGGGAGTVGSLAWVVARAEADRSGTPITIDFGPAAHVSSFDLHTAAPLTLTGSLDVAGALGIEAPAVTVGGTVRAAAVSVKSLGLVQVLPGAALAAQAGGTGGTVAVSAATIMNFGAITANGSGGAGGRVSEAFTTSYLDTTAALTAADGATAGGQVMIDGGATGRLFTSGRQEALGGRGAGGIIHLGGQAAELVGGSIDASGATAGGRVVVLSEAQTDFAGSIVAHGGRGGFIEVSSHGALTDRGQADPGPGGTLRLDPRNLTIDNAHALIPRFNLVDPNATAGGGFGAFTVVLPNGNLVVTAPQDTVAGVTKAGAAYLYDGRTGALISALTGTATNDEVGLLASALTNGNYVIESEFWAGNRGAVTFGNGTSGVSGTVSLNNSLVGNSTTDFVGSVTALSNGNYVVLTSGWNGGVGATTWGSGTSGVHGTISVGNSLVGTATSDNVGSGGVRALTNGNYVVLSPNWNGGIGAATWGNGAAGTVGQVAATNSLVGTSTSDNVGSGGVTPLTNGNYVVISPNWNGLKGAVTWGNGHSGVTGQVLDTNSLVGTAGQGTNNVGDQVGSNGVTALTNGNYVVASPNWSNPLSGVGFVGAATWGSGTTGISGAVSSFNSLVGSTRNDNVANGFGVTALTNGNYVVCSPSWTNPNGSLGMAGAATWGNGSSGTTGAVSSGNSLVGTHANDQISAGSPADFGGGGEGVAALTNGNYVVASPNWNNNRGAATFGSGTTGVAGSISLTNSLLGSTGGDISTGDGVGHVFPLSDGNYVVASVGWNNATVSPLVAHVGAATFGNGTTGTTGTVAPGNSLIGSTASDDVGAGGVLPLSNGNYAVVSSFWNNGSASAAGAVTFINAAAPVTGPVTTTNSFVGTVANELVGSQGLFGGGAALNDGNYLIETGAFANGGLARAGAVTLADGTTGRTLDGQHSIDPQNSIVGSAANTGLTAYADPADGTFVVTSNAGGGQVMVAVDNPNQITTTLAQGQDLATGPLFLEHTLNAGTAVTLQATDTITVGSPVAVSAGGHGGNLTFQDATLLLNADVNTDGGTLTLGGTVSPGGTSSALVHLSAGSVAFRPNSTFAVQLNGAAPGTGFDQLQVNGPIDLTNATLSVPSATGTASSFVIVQSTQPITTTFAGLPEGHTVPAGGRTLRVSYLNDRVTLSAAVSQPPAFTSLNHDTFTVGTQRSFPVTASGSPAPTLQERATDHLPANVSFTASTGLLEGTPVAGTGGLYTLHFTAANGVGTPASQTFTLAVQEPPAVTTPPADQTVNAGQTVHLSAAASGFPVPSVQWQVRLPGGTFTNIQGATAPTLTFLATAARDGEQFRAIFTNPLGSATSSAATLTVHFAPQITAQPANAGAAVGGAATFQAAAVGDPAPTVQWQKKAAGATTFADLPGQTASTLTLSSVAQADGGSQYRAVFTDPLGTATTRSATLTVGTAPQVANPQPQHVRAGQTATFTAAAIGTPAPSVQWQVLAPGALNFAAIPGATAPTLRFVAQPGQDGNQYRALFTNPIGQAVTTAVALTVDFAPQVSAQPAAAAVAVGRDATFTAHARAEPAATVQWQVKPVGGTFADIPGATSATLTVPAVAQSDSGKQYRAVFTNPSGTATSQAAALLVGTVPQVTSPPQPQQANAGQTVTFRAAASGTPAPAVQWQVLVPGAAAFANVAGATSPTLTFTAQAGQDGRQYRVVFTNAIGHDTSTAALLTVFSAPVVTAQPADAAVVAGHDATFTAAASANPGATVQWQVRPVGGTFADIPGATGTTLTVSAVAAADSGKQYRAVFTNARGTATSRAATLSVDVPPTIALGPADTAVRAGEVVTFRVTTGGTPAPQVQWLVSTDGGATFSSLPGATGRVLSFTAQAGQQGYRYRAVVTNPVGQATSDPAELVIW